MRLAGLVVLLAGCDRLFLIDGVTAIDAQPGKDAAGDARGGDAQIDAAPGDGASSLALVQQTAIATLNNTMLHVPLAQATVPGDVLVMAGAADAGALTNVTGGGVAMWTLVVRSTVSPDQELWFGVVATSATSLDVDGPTSSGPIRAVVSEWRGLDPVATSDTANMAGNGSTGNNAIDVPLTTTHAPDLVMFAISSYGNITDPPAGWMELLQPTNTGGALQRTFYLLATTPSSQPTRSSSAGAYDAVAGAFRAM